MINNTYFDVFINNNHSFYIIQPSVEDSAVKRLQRIEVVVKNRLPYDSGREDYYRYSSRRQLFALLREKSSEILNRFKEENAFRFPWSLLSRQSQEEAIHIRIEAFIARIIGSKIDSLPSCGGIQKIAEYLSLFEAIYFLKINRRFCFEGAAISLKRAKELGCEGKSFEEAYDYIYNLFSELNELTVENVIPDKYLHYRVFGEKGWLSPRNLNLEKVLQSLQNELSFEDLFSLLSNEKIYSIFGFVPCFKKFLSHKKRWKLTTVNSQILEQNKNKALLLSAKNGDKNIVELLIRYGANYNTRSQHACTPLALATFTNKIQVVQFLIEKNADVNLANKDQETPLCCASRMGNLKMVRLLVESKANINARAQRQKTALGLAVECNKIKIVNYLLNKGADVNSVDKYNKPPLLYSASSKMSFLLLRAGAKATVNYRHRSGTALHYAVRKGNFALVQLLLEYKASSDIVDSYRCTPIMYSNKNFLITHLLSQDVL